MEYSRYSAGEFIEDPGFIRWVQSPDEASDQFWKDFLEQHPDKAQEVSNARRVLTAIRNQVESDFSNQSNENAVFLRIKEQIIAKERQPVRQLISWPVWAAAASVLVLLGFWFLNRPSASPTLSYQTNLEQAKVPLIERVNHTTQLMLVTLDDSSTVFLKPNSKISFAPNLNSLDNREVYLSGEAFFEVTKNPDKPFYVYANELITKVLGTSFSVKAFKDDSDVTVKVSTGRVSVMVANAVASGKQAQSPEAKGILLLPNQQAVLSRQDVRLVKSLVEDPALIADKNHKSLDERFIFAESPAVEVFKVLEEAYGLHFEFEEALFANCQFTANLTEESLYDKLDIICKSIEASYEINDGQVRISGKGCN